MDSTEFDQRLSRISTQWTALLKAHEPTTSSAAGVRADLVHRYSGAVFRYLLGAVRDVDVAEELSQEFVVRFLCGDFHRVRKRRGRFRDYTKTVLINLVNDHFRERQRQPRLLGSDAVLPASRDINDADSTPDFATNWREEILALAWAALQETRPTYYSVLRFRADNPEMPSSEIADYLTGETNKPVSASNVRKTLERARTKFGELVVQQVFKTLESPDSELLKAELKELDLLRYCEAAVDRLEGK